MGYRYIGSKARIADEIIEYINRTTFVEDPVIKNGILEGLAARRGERVTPMGYINIADGGSYTNGR